jgi:hypothetical protein
MHNVNKVFKNEISIPKKQGIFVFLFILQVLAWWPQRRKHVTLLNT